MSEKLPSVMAELLEVLKKHDVAGMIFLADPPHGEVGYGLSASWSCASMDNREFISDATDLEKFKATASAVSALQQLASIAFDDTSNMLATMREQRDFRAKIED